MREQQASRYYRFFIRITRHFAALKPQKSFEVWHERSATNIWYDYGIWEEFATGSSGLVCISSYGGTLWC